MPWFTDRVCINIIYTDIEHLHSHPWDYFTLILWGGYYETVYEDGKETTYTRRPGYFSRRSHGTFHRISPIKRVAVTFFIRSKKITKMGFAKYIVNGKVMSGAKYWLQRGIDLRGMVDEYDKR